MRALGIINFENSNANVEGLSDYRPVPAMHYGTLPLVRETGGLKDTVQPYNQYTGEGNGFSFWAANADDMLYTIRWAVEQYYDNRPGWKGLVKSAMNTDVSWENSAATYEQLYYTICNWEDK